MDNGHYTDEHASVAAVIYAQEVKLADAPLHNQRESKLAIRTLHMVVMGLAQHYREIDADFDYLRFIRECLRGPQ